MNKAPYQQLIFGFALAGLLILATPLQAQAQSAALPLRKVVLYNTGLAYYEHQGFVEGDTRIALDFRLENMNDVLKSLVLRDLGGGTIQTVQYGAQEPLERNLASFAINLAGNPDITRLLHQLTGQELELMVPQSLRCRLISLETRQVPQGDDLRPELYLNVLTDVGLRSLPLSAVQSVQILNKQLASDLNGALQVLQNSRDQSRRPVEIVCRGKGRREIRFAYIAEAPVWKTSYRLDLSGAKPYLQAWALVENTSDLDWEKVDLTLVGGQPLSFVQDLYSPQYRSRPVIAAQNGPSIAPPLYENAVPGAAAMPMAPPAPAPMQRSKSAKPSASSADDYLAESGGASLQSSFAGAATASVAGELYSFKIAEEVSIQRRQSAMLPLLADTMNGAKYSIYRQALVADRALAGAWVSLSGRTRLPGGPVTIYDANMYAGDAQIDGFSDTEKKLLAFAVDPDLRINTKTATSRRQTSFSLVKGILQQKITMVYETEYAVANSGNLDKSLLVEHPISSGRTLIAPTTIAEQTGSYYRLELLAKKAASNSLKVVEEQVLSESISILNSSKDMLVAYQGNTAISAGIRQALVKAGQLKTAMDELQQSLQNERNDRQNLERDQDRNRKNIESVGRDSPQGQKYIQRLVEIDNKIDQLDKNRVELQNSYEKLRKELENYLADLTLQ